MLMRLAEDDAHAPRYLPSRGDIAAIIGTTAECASRAVAEVKRSVTIREVGPHRAQVVVDLLHPLVEQ
jgi:hypothetical protein